MLSSSSSKEFFRNGSERKISAQTFTYWELAAATENFRPECFLGEGGFGRVYRGTLPKTQQVSEKYSFGIQCSHISICLSAVCIYIPIEPVSYL
jgi:hypothetical protein